MSVVTDDLRNQLEWALADRIIVTEYKTRKAQNLGPNDPYSVVVSIDIRKPDDWEDERDYWLYELSNIPFFDAKALEHKKGNRCFRYLLTECAMAHQSEMRVAA